MSMTETFEEVLRAVFKGQDACNKESVYGTPFGDFRMYWDDAGFHMEATKIQMPYWESDAFAPRGADKHKA